MLLVYIHCRLVLDEMELAGMEKLKKKMLDVYLGRYRAIESCSLKKCLSS